MKKLIILLHILIFAVSPSEGLFAADRHERIVPIPLSGDSPESVNIRMVSTSGENPNGKTILFVHGILHNANIFTPLTEAIVEKYGNRLSEVIAIDLPGHGSSSVGVDNPFGWYTMSNYVDTLEQVLAFLHNEGVSVNVLAGHSMGAEVVYLLQQKLTSQKPATNLYDRFGIEGMLLLAPAVAGSDDGTRLTWSYAESKVSLLRKMANYTNVSYRDGIYFEMPAEDWVQLFFTSDAELDSMLVDGAPTDKAVLEDLMAPEAYGALTELVGLGLNSDGPLRRPEASAGILSYDQHRTALATVAFRHDAFLRPKEVARLHSYLTRGDSEGNHFFGVAGGSAAIHDGIYTVPRSPTLLNAVGFLLTQGNLIAARD